MAGVVTQYPSSVIRPRLADFSRQVWSQFGEDGMIAYLLERVGAPHKTAVEFGGWDAEHWSNTALLRLEHGWTVKLIEADPERYSNIQRQLNGSTSSVVCAKVTPANVSSWLEGEPIDLLSIDVDSEDARIFYGLQLEVMPRVVVIEYNPTVPPHLDLASKSDRTTFASSALHLKRLGQRKGYTAVGKSPANLFLVRDDLVEQCSGLDIVWERMWDWSDYSYVVTDWQPRNGYTVGRPFWGYGLGVPLPGEIPDVTVGPPLSRGE
jgi:hypothetical protein